MWILYSSPHGVIIELEGGTGIRLVTTNGIIGPILRSPHPISTDIPEMDWTEDSETDLDAWLTEHGIERSRLSDPAPSVE